MNHITRRLYSTASLTPHPSLVLLPGFLPPSSQDLVLSASLKLLSAPARTTSKGRRLARNWLKANPSWDKQGFMAEEAYEWEQGHFDGVASRYRELLVKEDQWGDEQELLKVLERLYALMPPPTDTSAAPQPRPNPPPHLLMHLLHLSSDGEIRPHVDNMEAFGRTIVGLSLGSERVLSFRRVKQRAATDAKEGPDDFEVLVKPGDVYIQREPLRTDYEHGVLKSGLWDGLEVGGKQRLSVMLRDKLPLAEGRPATSGMMGSTVKLT